MKKSRSGLIMLAIVTVLYLLLYFMHPDRTMDALNESLGVLKMVLPVLLIVFF